MNNSIMIMLIILLIMFISGISMIVMTTRFVKKKEHPLLSILLAVLQCPCIYIPISLTIGFAIAKIIFFVTLVYGVAIIILSLKNTKRE